PPAGRGLTLRVGPVTERTNPGFRSVAHGHLMRKPAMAGITGSRGICHFGALTRRRHVMQPENDTQAVRRVLARAGITAAALTLSLGAAAPAAMAGAHAAGGHGGSGGSKPAGHDSATQDKSKHKSSSTGDSHHDDSDEGSQGGGSANGG